MTVDASYTYLPWVRQGLISAVSAGKVAGGRIELNVSAELQRNGAPDVKTTDVNIMLFGPGDVIGMGDAPDVRYSKKVLRTDPPPDALDFEPNYFPLIEFKRTDLPWIFSPVAPDGNNHLRPWICLIVVEKRPGVELDHKTQPLPVLSIDGLAHKELPDLSEAWAWAHAQVGSASDTTDLSRLMCPRRLEGKKAYYACVVPTYLGGVQAGLGEAIVGVTASDPAWTLGASSPNDIHLPVYYHWEFATGVQGDFEALVWQLERKQLTFSEVGTRQLAVNQAGYGLPTSDPQVDLEGVLGPLPAAGDAALKGPTPGYQARLQALLNGTAIQDAPVLPPPLYGRWHAAQRTIPDTDNSGQERNRPWLKDINLDPRYRVAAGLGAQVVRDQQEQLMASAWDQVGDIERANMLIRQAQLARATSIAIHKERFGRLDATTFLLVTGPVQPRARYAAAQTGQELTALGQVQASALPRAATSAQFRRMLRPRGVIARRFGIASADQRNQLISNLNQRIITPAPLSWPIPDGMLTMESLLDRSPCNISPEMLAEALVQQWPPDPLVTAIKGVLAAFANSKKEIDALADEVQKQLVQAHENLIEAGQLLDDFRSQAGPSGGGNVKLVISLYKPALALIAETHWRLARLGPGLEPKLPEIYQAMLALPDESVLPRILFGLAAIMLQQSVEPCVAAPLKLKPPLDIKELKTCVLAKIDPRITIAARLGTLIQAPGWKSDELDFVLAAPDFPAPMYKALTEQSQEWLLPGLERVPPNTLTLFESNARFIEAFMVGLNHEMSRELLWRDYPTDQRGTYFRQFWDPSGRFPAPQNEAERKANLAAGKDIFAIHEWKNNDLGTNFGRPGSSTGTASAPKAQTVLLIRGDLLRRYPRATVYAAKAEWSKDSAGKKQSPRNPTNTEEHPIFRGELAPDINFLGFNLDPTTAKGTPVPSSDPKDDGAGWFIVIQQQPTEPRYGLDETVATSPDNEWTWRDLAWPHVNLTEDGGYIKLEADLKAGFPSTAQKGPSPQNATWKWTPALSDSAQIACITLQGPVRVSIHASDLL